MNIENEQLKLKLIETQMMLLQYQHRDVSAAIEQIKQAQSQARFDTAADARDMPSGTVKQPDPYSGD